MRTYLTLLLLPLLISAQIRVYGDTTVNLDAGQLTSPVAAPMQIDDNSGSVNGSLLLILDLGAGNSVSDTLSPGDFVSGSNTILAAGGFNDNGGTNETLTAFDVNAPATVGDEIALRWFPQITLAQYNLRAVPSGGYYFGTYSPAGGNPDGGDTWTVPSSGSLIDLNFFTTDSDFGGTQSPSLGFAGSQVQAVPEPSTYALTCLGLLALFFIMKRRGASSTVQI